MKMEKDGGIKHVNNEETKKLLLKAGWKEVKEVKSTPKASAKKEAK